MMDKKAVRSLYKQKRLALGPEERKNRTEDMVPLLRPFLDSKPRIVMSFFSMEAFGEIDTVFFEEYILSLHPEVIFCYPKVRDNHMYAVRFGQESYTYINAFGTQEIENGILISPGAIDLVLTPLLAFDRRGYRVGYGKGYYDTFLANCGESTYIAGLSLFPPLDDLIETNEYDVQMHACITPGEVFYF